MSLSGQLEDWKAGDRFFDSSKNPFGRVSVNWGDALLVRYDPYPYVISGSGTVGHVLETEEAFQALMKTDR